RPLETTPKNVDNIVISSHLIHCALMKGCVAMGMRLMEREIRWELFEFSDTASSVTYDACYVVEDDGPEHRPLNRQQAQIIIARWWRKRLSSK
ncbi:MAG: hypothetical protein ACK55I_46860, partial [bacterium]